MNKEAIAGNGREFADKAKEKWGKLSNDRLDVIALKRDQLESEFQQAYRIIRGLSELHSRGFEEKDDHSPS